MRTIYVSDLLQYDFEVEPPLQVPMDTFLFIYLEMFLMCPWESVQLKWRTDTGTFSTSLMSTQINNNNFFQLHVPHSISVMLPTLQCNSIRGRWTLINGKSSFHYTKIKVYRLRWERFQAFSIKNSCYHPQKLTFSCGLTIFNESSLNLQFVEGIIREWLVTSGHNGLACDWNRYVQRRTAEFEFELIRLYFRHKAYMCLACCEITTTVYGLKNGLLMVMELSQVPSPILFGVTTAHESNSFDNFWFVLSPINIALLFLAFCYMCIVQIRVALIGVCSGWYLSL